MKMFWTGSVNNLFFLFKKDKHWKKIKYKGLTIFFSGFFYKKDENSYWSIQELVKEILNKENKSALKSFLKELDGHYTLVIMSQNSILMISDWINSYPLFYILKNNIFFLSNCTKTLRNKLAKKKFNFQGALEIMAGGYTLGNKTIYLDITKCSPGTFSYLQKGQLKNVKFIAYSPTNNYKKGNNTYKKKKKKFIDILDKTFSRLVDLNHDRKIFIPLSAGLDSRLILSGILRHGHKNITCYSYGLRGNTDTKIAKEIANKINIPFIEIVTKPSIVRNFSKNDAFKNYQSFYDSCSSVPFAQDLPALWYFMKKSRIPQEALFVNGNTGDFISGGHLPQLASIIDKKKLNKKYLAQLFLNKHFSLWDKYKTSPYRDKLEKEFDLTLNKLLLETDKNFNLFNSFETMEWYHRQIKFVISGQKVYEFIDRDWRLPLWEFPVKNFFEQLDYSNKLNQYFYRKVLIDMNWQGIWKELPINKKNVFPVWIRPVRNILKSIYFFIGKESWYNIEKKYINYWTSNTSSYSLVPYYDSLFNKDIFQNPISLRSIRYLEEHQLYKNDIH